MDIKFIKFIIKYILLGIITSMSFFLVLHISNYYAINRYPYASNLYIEVFKLYNEEILKEISWTKLYHKMGVSESTKIRVIGKVDKNMETKMQSNYTLLDENHLMYVSKGVDDDYLLIFDNESLVIGIFQ